MSTTEQLPIWCVIWREDGKTHRQFMQKRTPGEIRHLFNLSMRGGNARIVSVTRMWFTDISRVEQGGEQTNAA